MATGSMSDTVQRYSGSDSDASGSGSGYNGVWSQPPEDESYVSGDRYQAEAPWRQPESSGPYRVERYRLDPYRQDRYEAEAPWRDPDSASPYRVERYQLEPYRQDRYETEAPWRDADDDEPYWARRDSAQPYDRDRDEDEPYWAERDEVEIHTLGRRDTGRDRADTAPFGTRQYRSGNRWRERNAERLRQWRQQNNASAYDTEPSLAAPWTDRSTNTERETDSVTTAPLPDQIPVISVEAADPDTRFGQALGEALSHYRDIAAAGGWGTVPNGDALKPGMSGRRVEAMRRRLVISGELPRSELRGSHYDATLEAVVKLFQARHGLEVDGVVGRGTIAAMNVPVEARILQLSANRSRWRQSPPELGERYVLVNIPAFELEVIEDGATVMRMDVITGEPDHPTPIFSDRIDYVEFNPYWNVPNSITRDELIEQFAADPSRAQGFEVMHAGAIKDATTFNWSAYLGRREVPFTVRQTPGPTNALGQVKFMLPNRYNVYLHDTPAQYLFVRTSRALSHGCVRLSRPREFAYYLLGSKSGWSDNRVDTELEGDENLQVPLDRPLPIHFVYMTAWVDKQGMAHFRDDVYGRDGGAVATASNE